VKQSPPATAAFLLQAYQLTSGSDVTENGGYARSALLRLSMFAAIVLGNA